MLKNRLIFTLLYNDGNYMLSRNFSLQKVGDINWLKECYDYNSIAYSIDELIVLNVQKGNKNIPNFCESLKELTKQYFMPVAAGGGIESIQDAKDIIASGVDKLVLNSAFFKTPELIKELVSIYGSQCIIASLDYKNTEAGSTVFIDDGSNDIQTDIMTAAKHIEELGAGELYLTSMNDDGTGEGYDLKTLKKVSEALTIPVIASGGCGRYDQFAEAYDEGNVKAAATADLFNFMADALIETREEIIDAGYPMAKWDIEFFKKYEVK